MLTSPLRDRFGIVLRLDFYHPKELKQILLRSASVMKTLLTDEGAWELASRSRGTPRIANRLLRRVRDVAEVKGEGKITPELANEALNLLEVDTMGLDILDRKLLSCAIEKFGGGPVGIESLSAALGESRDTLEDVVEPFLIQQGFMMRTPRGRIITDKTYEHLGIQR